MKKILKKLFILVMTIFMMIPNASVFAKDEDIEAKYFQETKPMLTNMKEEMSKVEKNGDVNCDFIKEIMCADKGASDISKNFLKYGSSKEGKEIANTIIKNSTANIEEMKKLNETLQSQIKADNEKEAEYINDYEENLNEMESKIKDLKPSGNLEKDYLNIMIIYCNCSMKIYSNITKYSDNGEVKEKAEKKLNETKNCKDNISKLLEKSTSKK